MAVKRYDGTAWQVVAGKGEAGQAATSSSIATWVKTATGGETSVSGNDDNSQPLSYTVGQELVFINGALQKRGADYTATTGNSITGLTALAANDVVTVWTVNAFSVTNAISNTLVDAKGDLIVATGADTPGRLAVGSNNQVLTADSSTATGLKWSALPSPSSNWTLITSGAVTSGTVATLSVGGYNQYVIHFNIYIEGSPTVWWRFNNLSSSNYRYGAFPPGQPTVQTDVSGIRLDDISAWAGQPAGFLYINNANTGTKPQFFGDWTKPNTSVKYSVSGLYNDNITISEINLVSTSTIGEFRYRVWGL